MTLLELFQNCDRNVRYESVGKDVNYAFVERGSISNRTLYIYFQGSSQKEDWLRNFMFKKRPYKDMKIRYRVHRGFLKAWKEVEDIIIDKVTQKDYVGPYHFYKYRRIVIIGYSHGGALAAFCHECVWFHRPDLRSSGLEGYGFEAPRIYGGFKVKKELAERWEKFTVIRTNNDIVTHMPPRIFSYSDVGTLMQIYGDTSLVENKLPKCIKSHYPQVVEDALKKKVSG